MSGKRQFLRVLSALKSNSSHRCLHTSKSLSNTFTTSDAIMPQPMKTKLTSYLAATFAISLGVTAGALISKNIASFLEENDLFVPSDDDDDD